MTRWIISLFIFLFCSSLIGGTIGPMPVAYASQIVDTSLGGDAVSSAPAQNPSLYLDETDGNSNSDEDKLPKACQFSWYNLSIGGLLQCLIGSLMGAVAKAGIYIGQLVIRLGVALNGTIFADGSIARTGFDISLGLTNLIFVIAIIVIAFAIMLRWSPGGRSGGRMLATLLVVALLINFSFLIATTLVKVSDGVMHVFLDASVENNGWTSLSDSMTAAFLKNDVADGSILAAAGGVLKGIMGTIVGMLFSIVFGALAGFTLGAIGVMLIIRYVALTILIILLPFALLGLVFSAAGGWWTKWSSQFTKWIIFGPAMTFFIYLAFALLASKQYSTITGEGVSGGLGNIGGLIAIIGILLGGLMAANSIGVAGAGTAMSLANQGKGWAMQKLKRGAIRTGDKALGAKFNVPFTKDKDGKARRVGLQDLAQWGAKAPVAGRFGGAALAGAIDKRVGGLKSASEDRQKEFGGMSKETMLARAGASRLKSAEENSAVLGKIMAEGWDDDLKKDDLERMLAASAKLKRSDEILARRPDLADRFGKDIAIETRKIKDVHKISSGAFKNLSVLGALSDNQIKDLGKFAKDPVKQDIYAALDREISANNSKLKQIADRARDVKISKNKEDKQALDQMMDALSAQEKGIVQNYNTVRDSVHFAKPLTVRTSTATMIKDQEEELKKPAYIRKKEQGDSWRS